MKQLMNAKRVMMGSAVLLALSMGLTSCGSCMSESKTKTILSDGPRVTDFRPLKGFEEIEINGSPRVYYTQADSFSVCVKGTREAVDEILTDVQGTTLSIRNRGKINLINISLSDNDGLAVYVTSPDLTSVRLNGSGDFETKGKVDTDKMTIILRGSGDIDMKDILCDRCEVELIGSGDISLDRLEALDVSALLVGSGDMDLGLQRVKDTKLSLKGSGDIKAGFKDGCGAVDCELRGSGDISLEGAVQKFSHHKSGSGDIDYDHLTVK